MLCVQHHQALIPVGDLSLLLNVLYWYNLNNSHSIAHCIWGLGALLFNIKSASSSQCGFHLSCVTVIYVANY